MRTAHLVPLATPLVLEVHLVVEDGVLEHLVMHKLSQLHAGWMP